MKRGRSSVTRHQRYRQVSTLEVVQVLKKDPKSHRWAGALFWRRDDSEQHWSLRTLSLTFSRPASLSFRPMISSRMIKAIALQ